MSKSRIEWIDFARSVAIIMVILCHAVESPFFYSNVDITKLPLAEQFFGFSGFTIGRLGVPIFLFISGYLLLCRSYDDESCWRFWKKNLLQLFIVTEIWIVIFNVCSALLGQQELTIVTLIKNMLFMKEIKMSHAWYLPMILSMYVTIPFVAMVLERIQLKTVYASVFVTAIYFFLLPTANVGLKIFERSLLSDRTFLYFGGGLYGTYLVVGYLFKKDVFDQFDRLKTSIIAGLLFVATVWFQFKTYQMGKGYKVWYNFASLLPIAITVFLHLKDIGGHVRGKRIWRRLAIDSFGIYLVHKPILNVLVKYFVGNEYLMVVRIMLLFIVALILSWSFVYLIAKTSSVGRWLFLIKEKT